MRITRIYFWLIIVLQLAGAHFNTAHGEEYFAATAGEINSALNNVQPGDTITMLNGIWSDANILFKADGTPGDTILLRAETPGRVLLNGSSRLRIAGDYLKVDGLYFKGGRPSSGAVIEFRENSGNLANHSRLTNTVIVDYNPSSINTDYKWVSIYGQYNRVDHCLMRNKKHSGTTLVVWLNGQANYHRIDHNYFAFRPDLGFNGGETIRIGTSDWSMSDSYTLVEWNYFERCDGEIEIISNKSGHNTFRYNTFYNCKGTLTLRHGNFAEVYGNFFFGNGNTSAGGVRIIGEDHKVYNNYFQDLYGSSFRSPLTIMNGVPNSPLNRYFQVKRATVMFNTFVNCRNPFLIGAGNDDERTLPPLDCVIANNVAYTTNSAQLIDYEDTPQNMQYEGNIMFGSPLGITSPGGIDELDPLLQLGSDSLWRPDNVNSPVIGAASGDYPDVTIDMDGHSRGSSKDVGADQYSTAPVTIHPVNSENTGPHWWPLPSNIQQVAPAQNALMQAVDNALPGDILELQSGEYLNDQDIIINVPLVIRKAANAEDRPVIRNNNSTAEPRSIFVIQQGGSLRLDSIELDGMAGSATPARYIIRTDDQSLNTSFVLNLNDCYLRDVGDDTDGNFFRAHAGSYADSLVFANCLFENSTGIGLRLNEEVEGSGEHNADWLEISNCTFWETGKEAIFVYGGDTVPFTPQPRVRINHSTFDNCGNNNSRIIYLRDCDASSIKNSIFSNSPGNSESLIIEGLLSTISYCDTFNVGPLVTNRDAGTGNGMVNLDPLYENRLDGNFTLAGNSPVLGLADDGEALGDLRWVSGLVAISDDFGSPAVVEGFILHPNFPNPFNPTTTIQFELSRAANVQVNIYDSLGASVVTLLNESRQAGSYYLQWDASEQASGVYFYELKVADQSQVRKMLLLK